MAKTLAEIKQEIHQVENDLNALGSDPPAVAPVEPAFVEPAFVEPAFVEPAFVEQDVLLDKFTAFARDMYGPGVVVTTSDVRVFILDDAGEVAHLFTR